MKSVEIPEEKIRTVKIYEYEDGGYELSVFTEDTGMEVELIEAKLDSHAVEKIKEQSELGDFE